MTRQPAPAQTAVVQRSAVTLQQLPVAAQQTIQAQTGGAGIQTIRIQNFNGQPVYNVQFLRNGQMTSLFVAQDGSLAGNTDGTAIASANLVPLSGAALIDFAQVPAEVQRILRTQAGTAKIETVTRGEWNGQVVFQAMIEDNGITREVQVEANGTILNGPEGALHRTNNK